VSALHIDNELLDRYALGSLAEDSLAGVEEHLLTCEQCQGRLLEADEFIGLFRAAAMDPSARRQPLFRRLFPVRVMGAAGAAAVLGALFLTVSINRRESPGPPATVMMQALRGPEAPAAIAAGKPVELLFDFAPTAPADTYAAEIVDLSGKAVLTAIPESRDSRLNVSVHKLARGSYWVRLYQNPNRELIAEYALRVN
jgi:anti-sigma factor RsiW